MRLRLLGPLEVIDDDPIAVTAGRQRGVLALLAIRAGDPVDSDWLIDQLWTGEPPRSARTTLQSCVYRLRARFRGMPLRIESTQDGYTLHAPAGTTDLEDYERLVASGREALADGRAAVAAARLREALDLWSGDFLADIDLPAVRERGRQLEQDRLDLLETCLECELELGRHSEIVPELEALAQQHPLRERPWQVLMGAQYAAGRRAEALETYQRLRRVLDEQLGVEPSAAARELQSRILEAEPAPARQQRVTVPRQLPPGIPVFTGRQAELKRLDECLGRSGLCVVVGPAGVGKTSTAVHWARRVAERFPDGQLYADLRGFDPSGQQADPGTTLGGFVAALGTSPGRIPRDLAGRTALFRSLLDDRRVLIVLDNARSAEQVRPLLAGGLGCLTVVTSRDRLAGLVATEQASPVPLGPFDREQARLLLEARIGTERAADTQALDELLTGCAGLPLALAIVCAQAGLHPDWPLANLADGVRPAVLDALSGGDRDARAVFSWSYRLLSEPAARLFRLLGVHPGPELGTTAAAALAGVTPAHVRPLLDELCGSHQLTETAPGRYALHDLLRSYAIELAGPAEATDALARLLDLMTHTAYAAARQLSTAVMPVQLEAPDPIVVIDPPGSSAEARDWFLAEHRALIGLTLHDGVDPYVWRLARALSGFLHRQGLWQDWLAVAERGLAAATRVASVREQAVAHRTLAKVHYRLGRPDQSLDEERLALGLSQSAGDLDGAADAYLDIGVIYSGQGLVAEAMRATEEALRLATQIGNRSARASALNNLAWGYDQLGDHDQTIRCCEEALAEFREIGDLPGEADTLHTIGHAHAQLGRYDDALRCFRRGIGLQERFGRQLQLAITVDSAGDVLEARGDSSTAREHWRRALDLYAELGRPEAATVRAKLS